MSTNLTAVLQQLLQNTSNLKVLRELMTPEVTYVSLNFTNPELKKIEPWAGTHKGPEALADVFAGIQRYWTTLDRSSRTFCLLSILPRRLPCWMWREWADTVA